MKRNSYKKAVLIGLIIGILVIVIGLVTSECRVYARGAGSGCTFVDYVNMQTIPVYFLFIIIPILISVFLTWIYMKIKSR